MERGRKWNINWKRKWDIPCMFFGWCLFGLSMQRWETGRDFFGNPCDKGGICFYGKNSTGPNFEDSETRLYFFSGLGMLAVTTVLGLLLGGSMSRNQKQIIFLPFSQANRLVGANRLVRAINSNAENLIVFVFVDIIPWLLTRPRYAGLISVVCAGFFAHYLLYSGEESPEVEVEGTVAYLSLVEQFYLPIEIVINCITSAAKSILKSILVYISAQFIFFLAAILPTAICYLLLYTVVAFPQWIFSGFSGFFGIFCYILSPVVTTYISVSESMTLFCWNAIAGYVEHFDFDATILFLKDLFQNITSRDDL